MEYKLFLINVKEHDFTSFERRRRTDLLAHLGRPAPLGRQSPYAATETGSREGAAASPLDRRDLSGPGSSEKWCYHKNS